MTRQLALSLDLDRALEISVLVLLVTGNGRDRIWIGRFFRRAHALILTPSIDIAVLERNRHAAHGHQGANQYFSLFI